LNTPRTQNRTGGDYGSEARRVLLPDRRDQGSPLAAHRALGQNFNGR